MTIEPIHFDDIRAGDVVQNYVFPQGIFEVDEVHSRGTREAVLRLHNGDGEMLVPRDGHLSAWALHSDVDLKDLAIRAVFEYGSSDGAHHKQAALDRVLRILTDCPVVCVTARAGRDDEYSYTTYGESEEYRKLIADYQGEPDEDGDVQWVWDVGIPG